MYRKKFYMKNEAAYAEVCKGGVLSKYNKPYITYALLTF